MLAVKGYAELGSEGEGGSGEEVGDGMSEPFASDEDEGSDSDWS